MHLNYVEEHKLQGKTFVFNLFLSSWSASLHRGPWVNKKPSKQDMLKTKWKSEAQNIPVSLFQETLALGNQRETTDPWCCSATKGEPFLRQTV